MVVCRHSPHTSSMKWKNQRAAISPVGHHNFSASCKYINSSFPLLLLPHITADAVPPFLVVAQEIERTNCRARKMSQTAIRKEFKIPVGRLRSKIINQIGFMAARLTSITINQPPFSQPLSRARICRRK